MHKETKDNQGHQIDLADFDTAQRYGRYGGRVLPKRRSWACTSVRGLLVGTTARMGGLDERAECWGVATLPACLSAATTFAEAFAKPPRLWALRPPGESDTKEPLDFKVSSKSVSIMGPGIIGPGARLAEVGVISLPVLGAEPAGEFGPASASPSAKDGPAMRPVGVCDCHRPCKEWSAREPLGLAAPEPTAELGELPPSA